MTYPTPPDWDNLLILHKNTLPPRTHFLPYPSASSALSNDPTKSNSLLLSGKWKFHWSSNPFEAPDITEPTTNWDEVNVPSMWNLKSGGAYGKGPQYTNVHYPFPLDFPHPPYLDNETGTYCRSFAVPPNLRNQQIRLRFEGVDSSFHVYINGVEVGYSQGSRNPSEFDITQYLNEGENELRVRVYQRCDGCYLEDQDQWWLSGIFRDVRLIAFPLETRVEDLHVNTTFVDDSYTDSILHVKVITSSPSTIDLTLLDQGGNPITSSSQSSSSTTIDFKIPIASPNKWTAETPFLYKLLVALPSSSQFMTQKVGFRTVSIVNGILTANGRPIKLRGVNRHEHHPDFGRTIPYEWMKRDLLMMKQFNINAIRTSHQPNDPSMLDLADQLGFWVISEADLECHGTIDLAIATLTEEEQRLSPAELWEKVYRIKAGKYLSDNPDWKEAYLDRIYQLVARDRNHPSTIMWSLGNESFAGSNFHSMYDLCKRLDPSRLVHYEGDNTAGPSDIFTEMYLTIDQLVTFATKESTWTKPHLLCEYAHAMGVGPGNLKEYIDTFYKYPRLSGGFVWEWASHDLLTTTEDGEEFYGYGGSMGEADAELNDGKFSLSGMLTSGHEVGSGIIEYAKAIQPVQVIGGGIEGIRIINRYDFETLDGLSCHWEVVGDGNKAILQGEVDIPKGVKPHQEGVIIIPELQGKILGDNEAYLKLEFSLKKDQLWAKAGHVVAWDQIQLVERPNTIKNLSWTSPTPTVTQDTKGIIEITCASSTFQFNLVQGYLSSWKKAGQEIIHTPPILDFFRALTDNDNRVRNDGKEWLAKKVDMMKNSVFSSNWTVENNYVQVVVKARIAPPVFDWGIAVTWTWKFSGDGEVYLNVKGTPTGQTLPPNLPRIGLTFSVTPSLVDTASWFGRGPGQSYCDMKESQAFGTWTSSVENLFTHYEHPQDNGNRTDISWVEFGSDKGPVVKANFGNQPGCSFSASHYTVKDLDDAQYPHQLRKKKLEEVIIKLDWRHHGLGSGSCGPKTMNKYSLKSDPFEFGLLLQ